MKTILALILLAFANTSAAQSPSGDQIKLKKLAESLPIERVEFFGKGIYGKIGSSTVFVGSREEITDFDQLYISMIQVLSTKYGCFMTGKKSTHNRVHFFCRDNRVVVMRRKVSDKIIYFYGDQYWQDGTMVVIDRKQQKTRRLSH